MTIINKTGPTTKLNHEKSSIQIDEGSKAVINLYSSNPKTDKQ